MTKEIITEHEINVIPIGTVTNLVSETKRRERTGATSKITINKQLEAALDGVERFSHLIVIYWMNKLPRRQCHPVKVHPKGDQSLPLIGVFATRSPQRPNPIGVMVVKLIKRRKNVLEVAGLDALNGMPVLDIKPYIPSIDSVNEASAPEWLDSCQFSSRK